MRTLIFLHGFLEDASMWKPFSGLEKEYRCIYVDLPGHGKNKGEENGSTSMKEMAQHVFAELAQLNVQSYDCIGHSMGGYVALELAQMDVRLKKIVLFHSNHWTDSDEKKMNRVRVAKTAQKNLRLFVREAIPNLFLDAKAFPKQVHELVERAAELQPKVVANCSLAMKNRRDFSLWIALNKERCYLIQGAADKTVLLEVSKEKWSGEKSNLYVIQACGHMGHLEKTREVLQLIKSLV